MAGEQPPERGREGPGRSPSSSLLAPASNITTPQVSRATVTNRGSAIPFLDGRDRLQVGPERLQLDLAHLSVRLPWHLRQDPGAVLSPALAQRADEVGFSPSFQAGLVRRDVGNDRHVGIAGDLPARQVPAVAPLADLRD